MMLHHVRRFCHSCYGVVDHRQIGLIYSLTPYFRLCQKGFCIGVSWKDKAWSCLSFVTFSKHQPAFSIPLPENLNLFVSFIVFHFPFPIIYQTKKIKHKIWTSHLEHRSHNMRKWLQEALMVGPYVQALYISQLTPSALPDHHNLVCLQHKVWSKLGWVH